MDVAWQNTRARTLVKMCHRVLGDLRKIRTFIEDLLPAVLLSVAQATLVWHRHNYSFLQRVGHF